ncbi:C-C motif chemokine 22 isoform X1 [Crocuta crocuta]
MASLKTLFLAVLVLLAVTLQATEAGPYGANVEDSICCRDYFRGPLPFRMLKYFYWTSDSCRRPGVVNLTSGESKAGTGTDYLYTYVHGSILHSSQKVGTTPVSGR